MKKLLFISGILVILFACSSEKVNFSQLQDRNGLFYLANKDKPFTGDIVSYNNGKVDMEGRVEEGLRVGLWTSYYTSGQKKTEGNYKEGLKDGTWTSWKDNGQQDVVEVFKFGKSLSNEGTVKEPPKDTAKVQPVAVAQPAPAPKPVVEKPVQRKPQPVLWERLRGGPTKYLDDVPYSGPVVKYGRDGKKEFDGYMQLGKKSGKWVYYDMHGNVKDVKYY